MPASRPAALAILLLACNPYPPGLTDSSEPATTTTVAPPGPATSTSSSTATATTDPDTVGFLPLPDIRRECDPWIEDCPEGQKCVPATGNYYWDSLVCIPIVPDPAGLGEPCAIVGERDTCDKHLLCWDLIDGIVGTCHELCSGSWDMPSCSEPNAACTLVFGRGSGDVPALCIPFCDPLIQNCAFGDVCIPNPQYPDTFICIHDGSGTEGQAFDPCEYANACDPGLYCFDPVLAAECDPMGLGCCLPFCDTAEPGTCPGQGQECLPWYEPGMAPPGSENLGVCGLPQP